MNLFTPDEFGQADLPNESAAPAWLVAADNHNLGNTRGGSWFDPDTWTTKFENAGKLIATGVLSGANSFYNTGVTIGNWLGADMEINDTKNWISNIDDDLGKYYSENQDAADLVGFLAGSIVPGMLGVKVLNAGQVALRGAVSSGFIGGNLGRAVGLLAPKTSMFVQAAASDILAGQAAFTSLTSNGIKALASGVVQNALEGIAFETAVQATMFKSPILESQDAWDITKNIAMGGVMGGVIGGAFAAAATRGEIKALVSAGDRAVKPFASRTMTAAGTSPADRIVLMTEDRTDAITKFAALGADSAALDDTAFRASTLAHTQKIARIDNDMRIAFRELAKDDTLGNMLADAHTGLKPAEALNNMLGVQEIAPMSRRTAIETLIAKNEATPAHSISYVKLSGENAGRVENTAPTILNLADMVTPKAGQSLEDAVLSRVRTADFKPGQSWNPLDLKGANKHLEAESRYIWADKLLKEIEPGTKIHQYDFPVLERALKDGVTDIKIVDSAGAVLENGFLTTKQLADHLQKAKTDVAAQLLTRRITAGAEERTEEIAKIVNTKLGRLEGTAIGDASKDFAAWQTHNQEYAHRLAQKGVKSSADARFLPSYAKVTREAPELLDVNGNILDGMTWIKTQQKIQQQSVDMVVARHAKDLNDRLPEITDAELLHADRNGAGAGLVTSANGGYGSLESKMQTIGAVTKDLKQEFRTRTESSIQGTLYNMLQKQEAAIEFSTINQKVTRSAEQWVQHRVDDGAETYLVTKRAAQKHLADGVLDFDGLLSEFPEDLIQIHNKETADFITQHISRSGERTTAYRELRGVQGMENVKDADIFRPIRQNPKDYPYFAFVKDPTVTGQGHTTMIWADSEARLQELAKKVPQKYQVVFKKDTEEFFKARGEYDYARTLHENYINTDLKNSGVMSDFFTKTDPQKIVNDILQQHVREDDTLAVELIRGKYQKAFDWLEDQGDAYTRVSSSKLGSYSERLEAAGKNPYLDYIKTALDISKMGEHPLLKSFNTTLDSAVSKVVGNVRDAFDAWKAPLDTQAMDQINSILDKYGMNTGYRDAATELLVNHTAPKGELTKFIRGANAMLSRLTLGLDPLNAVNNAVGANVLRGTELKQLTDAIKGGNDRLAGDLAKLAKIQLPGGTGAITSPTKLLANAVRNFVKDDGKLATKYRNMGLIKNYTEQFKSILDDFTLRGTETVGELNSRLSSAFAKTKELVEAGEKYTGNKFAEEFNRFISANVMDQLTAVGVKHGVLKDVDALSYINTFVNRVEGNIIASQRPLMLQGPIGQAVGLFQSYQFNLMQQMFRYAAEGSKKDIAMLMGLQGTFYGMQGLPAFQFINQHVIGTLSGNQDHRDAYDALYGIAGTDGGDLLTYGLASNLLRTNLYSRGDINPRHVTILPSNVADIPIVGAFGKFLGNVANTVGNIQNGANVWQSLLQGLEHNGVSRPLAGLAQTLQAAGPSGQVFSTTSKGSILSSNDLLSWATLTRLAGGRPLDEAIINDGVYRIQAYQAIDQARMNTLSQAVRTSGIQGESLDETQVIKFAQRYAELGGKQASFNKYMLNQIKNANQSQAEMIVHQLKQPLTQKMQLLMGGSASLNPESLMGSGE